MEQKKQNHDDLNSIEQRARQLFGYDEDSLLAEMDEAERVWEAEKAADPEAAARVQREAEEGFQNLMDHIKAEGIRPVTEEEYERERQKEQREEESENLRAARTGRKRRKILLLAAAVCVLGVGMTIVVSARREYKYNLYPVEGEQNILVKKNSVMKMKADKLEEAYAEIEEKLGIKSLKLGYTLSGMKFKEGVLSAEHAIIELEYNGVSIYLKEEKYSEDIERLQLKTSDRKSSEKVYNEWLDVVMIIEENKLKSGLTEYSTFVNMDDSYYSLSGKIDKGEFIQMAQGLYY